MYQIAVYTRKVSEILLDSVPQCFGPCSRDTLLDVTILENAKLWHLPHSKLLRNIFIVINVELVEADALSGILFGKLVDFC
jgi:hypothetical protein